MDWSWNGGMEWWNGMVEWNGGIEWWKETCGYAHVSDSI